MAQIYIRQRAFWYTVHRKREPTVKPMSEPFLTDIHTHGLERISVKDGTREDFLNLARLHFDSGTGRILPTLYPQTLSRMRHTMAHAREAMNEASNWQRAEIAGLHLEGPFLNPEYAGALDSRHFMAATTDNLFSLIDGYEEIIRIITISPELPGALELISRCRELGIKVNMGHSGATFSQAESAKEAGATGTTHIFNAMRPLHHREPGLAGFALTDPETYVEVIADGVHLDLWTLKLILRNKPLDLIIAVSDSVSCKKRAGKGAAKAEDGSLLGGGAPLSYCLPVLKGAGLSEEEIHLLVSENPIRYLGL